MSGRVLVVDDSLTIRMDLVGAFENAGIAVAPCASVREAREALGRESFPLVILDVLLPDGDGVELLEAIRASETARAYVVVLSTEAELRDRVRGMTRGADEYLAKPYDVEHLVARARQLGLTATRETLGRPRILLIDDSPTFRSAAAEALERAGYDVVQAETGELGLRLAASVRPAAILVDGQLPGIDGPGVIRRIRLDAALRTTPCVLLTASGRRNDELDALDAGADGFAHKEADLTVVVARLAAVLRSAASVPLARAATGQKKVLAVDDSRTYLQELGQLLRDEGYDVVLASSGEEALELLAVHPVDCVLLDVVMPGLSGQETCARIRASSVLREVPIIMLTGLEDREAMIAGLAAGADDYVSKANEPAVLRARVRAQIRRRQFEAEARHIREELLARQREVAEANAARELAETRAALAIELERKNEELEAFSYTVSHDLRAPLRAIDGFSQALAVDHAALLPPEGREHLDHIRRATQRMGELIEDLLALARLSRAAIRPERVDVSTLATTILGELRAREPARDVREVVTPSITVHADARLMRAVLENLLANAWKFTRNKPGARIELGPEAEGFYVADDGAGFDPTQRASLFRPFRRLHSEREFEGTGIGLATVRRIVERHGGSITAEGAVGRGATFRVRLPPSGKSP